MTNPPTPTSDETPSSTAVRFCDLVHSFPALQDVPMDLLLPHFQALRFDQWAQDQAGGSGFDHAARFILHVWNNRHPWEMGRFDMMGALAKWDLRHLRAFQKFVQDPFQP